MPKTLAALLVLACALLPAAAAAQPYGGGNRIVCESDDGRYRECSTGFRGPADLTRQRSDTRCIEGRNWGSRPGVVWVDSGCRGEFAPSRQGWGQWEDYRGQRQITCESTDERYRQCNADFRGRARLVQQLSRNPCIEGRSWGQGPGLIWVSRGCRARFEDVGWRGDRPGYDGREVITCESRDNRRRDCAWDPRWGRPQLVEQLSDRRCIEGSTWGTFSNVLWVDNGCRGRFARRRY